MNYYDKKNSKSMESFRLALIWLAYIIIFWTLWNVSVVLFAFCLSLFITIKIFKINVLCRFFGHLESDKPKHNIIRCKRCNYPIRRIK